MANKACGGDGERTVRLASRWPFRLSPTAKRTDPHPDPPRQRSDPVGAHGGPSWMEANYNKTQPALTLCFMTRRRASHLQQSTGTPAGDQARPCNGALCPASSQEGNGCQCDCHRLNSWKQTQRIRTKSWPSILPSVNVGQTRAKRCPWKEMLHSRLRTKRPCCLGTKWARTTKTHLHKSKMPENS